MISKPTYFNYDMLMVELGWQNSNLIQLDNAKQATSNQTSQNMLLMTPMDQLMHQDEQANFPF